eukprot:1205892-Rhodomonas_salina.2
MPRKRDNDGAWKRKHTEKRAKQDRVALGVERPHCQEPRRVLKVEPCGDARDGLGHEPCGDKDLHREILRVCAVNEHARVHGRKRCEEWVLPEK